MKVASLLAALSAASLVAAPVAAQVEPSQVQRSSASIDDESHLRGGFTVPLIAIIAIILGVLAFSGGDDQPHSP